jgi:hypothetical protein
MCFLTDMGTMYNLQRMLVQKAAGAFVCTIEGTNHILCSFTFTMLRVFFLKKPLKTHKLVTKNSLGG